ncbi:MAG: hypothetical protein WAS05_00805 [Candidatus Nanopelagicales bacterium]
MSDKFEYEIDGATVSLPKMDKLPVGVLRKVRKLDQADQMFTLLEELLTDEELSLVDKLDSTGLEDLMRAWNSDAGIDLPK